MQAFETQDDLVQLLSSSKHSKKSKKSSSTKKAELEVEAEAEVEAETIVEVEAETKPKKSSKSSSTSSKKKKSSSKKSTKKSTKALPQEIQENVSDLQTTYYDPSKAANPDNLLIKQFDAEAGGYKCYFYTNCTFGDTRVVLNSANETIFQTLRNIA
jgi:hypothetical protein